MVKKIKVVDVAPIEANEEVVAPIEESQPIEDIKEEVVETPIEKIKEVEEVSPLEYKNLEYINCDKCNKKVLLKTYKYSHQRVCKARSVTPPPPPPPPPPEPKKERPKRVSKPKEKKEEHLTINEPPMSQKPEFNGVASFDTKPFIDPYTAMRQERVLIRQQRVKSLISQAI